MYRGEHGGPRPAPRGERVLERLEGVAGDEGRGGVVYRAVLSHKAAHVLGHGVVDNSEEPRRAGDVVRARPLVPQRRVARVQPVVRRPHPRHLAREPESLRRGCEGSGLRLLGDDGQVGGVRQALHLDVPVGWDDCGDVVYHVLDNHLVRRNVDQLAEGEGVDRQVLELDGKGQSLECLHRIVLGHGGGIAAGPHVESDR
mmetsp:Transcript_35223/g.111317  ORF Transcript_35223/g.111317 Transcript_35223/m.111317 type:complete len:200 (+) Transcript_35223:250-849(+)